MLATIFNDPDGNPGHPSAIREARGVFKGQIKTLNTMRTENHKHKILEYMR